MEPAKSIIATCGGFEAVSEVTGRAVSSVRKWTFSKEKRGTGGFIPPECAALLLAASPARGWGLSPADFYPESVIDALREAG
ncbi:hypothetical protein AN189_07395 [Loktanella sp. 3ANDIMAR09]|uniref:hypothetical protein n=1 Tax=Loktanella sp. 3ANDIMAR09 TaxID=1225657 RepID=UPI0007003887|nr:hypothetical protein [Loktanella sp. 3ANDIMAR09]KQI68716.1 hypothetical protein AN189_07395 [Loktanella sp. 3ANDIMAR09]